MEKRQSIRYGGTSREAKEFSSWRPLRFNKRLSGTQNCGNFFRDCWDWWSVFHLAIAQFQSVVQEEDYPRCAPSRRRHKTVRSMLLTGKATSFASKNIRTANDQCAIITRTTNAIPKIRIYGVMVMYQVDGVSAIIPLQTSYLPFPWRKRVVGRIRMSFRGRLGQQRDRLENFTFGTSVCRCMHLPPHLPS